MADKDKELAYQLTAVTLTLIATTVDLDKALQRLIQVLDRNNLFAYDQEECDDGAPSR